MHLRALIAAPSILVAVLAGCAPTYSPDVYSAAAVQQASKVEPGVIVGVRAVGVSADGTVGAATGAAAGGVAGSQTPGGVGSAFGALGGALVGGLVGSAVEHSTADTTAFEYIVRKPNGDLVSVTQKDSAALPLGQKVLVIDGKQARIVPDYTVPAPATAAAKASTPANAVSVTSVVPPTAHVDSTPLPPPATPEVAAQPLPAFATPVPPPPLTPGAPTPLAPGP